MMPLVFLDLLNFMGAGANQAHFPN